MPGDDGDAAESLNKSIQKLSDQMTSLSKDFKALKPLIPAVNELVKLPAAMKSLAGSVKDAEQQTAALNLAVSKLEGSGSSKIAKHSGKENKKQIRPVDGDDAEYGPSESEGGGGDPSGPSSSSEGSRSPSPRRHRRADRDRDARRRFRGEDEEDRLPTRVLKIDFPTFDGSGDPLIWLNRCEIYFRGNKTPSRRRVWMASLHMTELAQLWYYKYEMNNGEPSWRNFVRLVQKRFGPTMTDTPLGSLALLRHAGNVVDYSNKFMHLACREAELSELQQVHLFVAGLQEPVKTDVGLRSPKTLDDAIMYARAYEQRQSA